MLDMNSLWNAVLSILAAFTVLWVKNTKVEISELRTVLYKTREENAKDYVTRDDLKVHNAEIAKRLDRLEEKIDTLVLKVTDK